MVDVLSIVCSSWSSTHCHHVHRGKSWLSVPYIMKAARHQRKFLIRRIFESRLGCRDSTTIQHTSSWYCCCCWCTTFQFPLAGDWFNQRDQGTAAVCVLLLRFHKDVINFWCVLNPYFFPKKNYVPPTFYM